MSKFNQTDIPVSLDPESVDWDKGNGLGGGRQRVVAGTNDLVRQLNSQKPPFLKHDGCH